MAEQVNQVACLRFPKDPNNILLPNVSVAEVIPYQAAVKESGPEWFMGFFSWRNTQVPVLSLEALNEQAPLEITDRTRYAVINRLSQNSNYDFFAVPIKDLPTLVRVYEDDLKSKDGSNLKSDMCIAELEQQTVSILDLEKLELLINQDVLA